ncbi:MAG: fibronectin type III domain-containing protein, partial [Verrucomicrobia bacterium]|nr:fibronectin type III domain-containing protein [Verrucomicrobiota bacterium]
MHTQLFLRILKSVVALFAAGWVSFTLTAFGQVPVVSPAAQAAHATITSYDGPATCIACHATQAQQMFGSVHYQEMGETPNVPNINGPAGKGLNGGKVMNSYCGTPTTSSRATCATCHVGNGRIPSTQLTTQQLTNIDCMMCHQDAYKRVPAPPMQTITFQGTNGPHSIQAPIEDETGFQYMPDAAKMTIPILDAARTVHLPTRASCLRCHAGAGGSDGGKRGDLSTVTVNPPATSDIHMSPQAADLSCANCHSAGGHRVAGRGVDLRPNDSTNRLACANCHTDRPHGDYSATTSSSRDLHAGHVACQTCHIPKFAKDKSTEMQRTWLAAGFSMAACRGQGGWVPHEVRATNVVPTYRWFDGTSLANVLDQVPPENAAGEYVLAWPNGSVQSAASKLYPMKVHRSDSAVQDASGLLIPHSTFAFFTSGDFTKAVQDGQAQSGLTGAASVVPVLEYQTINHGVESRTNALQCGACHSSLSPGGPARMNLQADLGYALKGTMTQVCSQCHGSKSNPGFASVHSRHVTNYRYDCSSCHNFSRPERGLTRISAIRPAAPSGPVATTVSASRIDLVWADNSTTEQGFKIERSTDGVSFTQISTVSANITVASDTGLTAGRPYYYRVRAYNTTGDSDYSMIGRANTAAGTTPTLPAAPSGLAATAASASQVNLTWTDNANNETGFAVERAVGTGSFVQIATLGANITSYADTALSANTTFSYRVRAYNSAGNSAYSATATATTPNVPPAAPSGLTATAASASQINLAWTDNANNETGFALERSSDNVTFTQIATVGANVTSYANTGLSASTTYYYRVRASNAAGNSAYSATASATTAAILTPPAAPSGLTATAASSSQINLAWTDNANNETGFAIERSTDNVTFTSIASVGANVTAYANTGLSASTTYYYRVRASNAAGNSAYSATASATTAAIQTPPAAPSGLTATAASAGQINLAWTDNA